MSFTFLNDFTNKLKEVYEYEMERSNHFQREGDLANWSKHSSVASKVWDILFDYRDIILNRSKWRFQCYHAEKVLQELNPELWELIKRIRRSRKKPVKQTIKPAENTAPLYIIMRKVQEEDGSIANYADSEPLPLKKAKKQCNKQNADRLFTDMVIEFYVAPYTPE